MTTKENQYIAIRPGRSAVQRQLSHDRGTVHIRVIAHVRDAAVVNRKLAAKLRARWQGCIRRDRESGRPSEAIVRIAPVAGYRCSELL